MSREPTPSAADKDKTSEPAESRDETRAPGGKRTRQIVAGAAIGIGSAALVAALLYANRGRKTGEKS
ncbi:hypothetical protein GCM10023232_07810 [Sphingosinicella ginsenosidimutans]|uniref:Uncharacterized protein n=1 Tax=Allosphingosinicella ginsenosidimutans TaxID=1176539 RepID=A0A5C6TXE0_9SPHN|nr:hypothetical protein [Sphingosinicella ginsenosidimutans]TXC64601.1 hypothetical protein FRZ32_13640 [Sphingosinicella ginsenosidimutans]